MNVARKESGLRLFAAEGLHTAALAHRLPGGTDGSAVEDEAVAEVVALVRWEQGAQDQLDLLLVGLVVQTQPAGDADAVGVDDDRARHTEDIAHHEVGGLSPDARQGGQLVEGGGYLAAVAVDQHARHRDDIAALGLIQPAGFYVLGDLVGRGRGEILRAGVAFKERGRDHVHACVGALGGEARRDETLERVGVFQRADGVGIFIFQRFDRGEGDLLFSHMGLLFLSIK